MQRILVVDDNTDFLQEMTYLSEEGFCVKTCADPTQAIDMIKQSHINCVLLDYSMPGLDGQDLLRLIRAQFPNINVLMVTGSTELTDTQFLREGAFEVLHKPVDFTTLLDALQRNQQHKEAIEVTLHGLNLKEAKDIVYRKMIIKAMSQTKFNLTRAAKLLGISRQNLLHHLKSLNIRH